MTKLLVSVRNLHEARQARDAGVDLIDVKEPARGSLGPADINTVRAIIAELGDQAVVSVALGEILDRAENAELADVEGARFAKWGLAGCGRVDNWQSRWQRTVERLPEGTRAVAVVYADESAAAPAAEEVLTAATNGGAVAILVDTFDKRGGQLLAHWPLPVVKRFVDDARSRGLLVAVAGSLDLPAIERILPLEPDYIAVRRAACGATRLDPLDAGRLKRLVNLVAPSGGSARGLKR